MVVENGAPRLQHGVRSRQMDQDVVHFLLAFPTYYLLARGRTEEGGEGELKLTI